MWPFRRKTKPSSEDGAVATQAPPTRPDASSADRTAEDVLRQLEAETKAAAQPILPDEAVDPNLGQCLLAEGPITRDYVERQLRVAGKADSYLGRLFLDLQAPTDHEIFAFLAAGYDIPEVDLKQCKVHVPTARSIPREMALKYQMVPIDRIGDILCVAFAGVPSPKGIEAIRRETGARVKILGCPPHHIQILLRRLYAEQPAAPSAPEVVRAEPISQQDYDQAAHGAAAKAEARWEALFASKGPIRATRLGRR